jgi:4-carboxymuconolactone decarboxylase
MKAPALFLITAVLAAAQDRMPPIAADKLTPAQKKSLDALVATPRGTSGTAGPFVPLLRAPELMDRLQAVGEYLRFKDSLPQKIVEMTILMTARQWTQQYEWNVHQPLAVKAGLKAEAAAAIAEGRRPVGLDGDEEIAYDFNSELALNKSVSDATYARVVKRFGEQGAIELTTVNGYYTTLAMIMSVARTPSPASALTPFTH